MTSDKELEAMGLEVVAQIKAKMPELYERMPSMEALTGEIWQIGARAGMRLQAERDEAIARAEYNSFEENEGAFFRDGSRAAARNIARAIRAASEGNHESK